MLKEVRVQRNVEKTYKKIVKKRLSVLNSSPYMSSDDEHTA
jgi:hypothetical protein